MKKKKPVFGKAQKSGKVFMIDGYNPINPRLTILSEGGRIITPSGERKEL